MEDIVDNYHDIQKNYQDLKFSEENFHEVLLKAYNKKTRKLTSERSIKQEKERLVTKYNAEYRLTHFVLIYLPFDLLENEDNITEKRIRQHFKRQIASQAIVYLNQLDLTDRKKHQILGYCFVFAKLSLNEDAFISYMKQKDKFYSYDPNDYLEYLRDEGYNALRYSKSTG